MDAQSFFFFISNFFLYLTKIITQKLMNPGAG